MTMQRKDYQGILGIEQTNVTVFGFRAGNFMEARTRHVAFFQVSTESGYTIIANDVAAGQKKITLGGSISEIVHAAAGSATSAWVIKNDKPQGRCVSGRQVRSCVVGTDTIVVPDQG